MQFYLKHYLYSINSQKRILILFRLIMINLEIPSIALELVGRCTCSIFESSKENKLNFFYEN